jgi:U4/U6 small nuclear ribonucleoprotein PRP4
VFVFGGDVHIAQDVLAVDFHPNGYQLATGSDDHTVRIWDLRKKKSIYTIPAHTGLISSLKFQPRDGHFLLTGSFDNTCKLWSGRDWSLLKILPGHSDKVTSVDISADTKFMISTSFDRTWKMWTSQGIA